MQNQHLYCIKSSLTFVYSRQNSQSLYPTPHVLHFLSCWYLHLILWINSARLLTKLDNEFVISLALLRFFIFQYFLLDNLVPLQTLLLVIFHVCLHHTFFYTIKCSYPRHWIPLRNMLACSCCGWFFKIIFTFMYSFN